MRLLGRARRRRAPAKVSARCDFSISDSDTFCSQTDVSATVRRFRIPADDRVGTTRDAREPLRRSKQPDPHAETSNSR
jgi:hypothetical protein